MLQDGVRGNNYLHRKNWTKVKKKHSCKRCAETTKGGWRRLFRSRSFFKLFRALPAGFLSSGWPDR